MKNSLIILDCTLRDGGYYNNWDFDQELVRSYLRSIERASIDIVEIGFRSPPKASFMGPFYYSTDEYLKILPLPDDMMIGVMINAKDYLEAAEEPKNMINKMFKPVHSSPVDIVRIAINFNQARDAEILVYELKLLGYQVGLNLMQAQDKSGHIYEETAEKIQAWETVDVLYFADSLGSMDPSQVSFICSNLRKGWKGPLGIHTHNNKGMALNNSLSAIDSGVSWCDSTIMGMGRGAGNVNTEALLLEYVNQKKHSGAPNFLNECRKYFEPLIKEYGWGASPYYHYAANHKIHPTYVQFILQDSRYDLNQVENILETLSNIPSTSFSETALREATYGFQKDNHHGVWNATGWLKNKSVILIGAGPSVKKYSDAIINYIKQHQPSVIFLNVNDHIPAELGTATIVAHESRILSDANRYHKLPHPLIIPESSLSKELKKELKHLSIFDYGLALQNGSFHIDTNGCILQWPLAFAYALCIVTQSQAKEILLVGFDGYEPSNPQQEEMNEVLSHYDRLLNHIPMKSLTPTNYNITQGSIFEPLIELNDFVLVIPARHQSSRFPGKPLADLGGKSLIRHVWDKCIKAVGAENVLVATDDERIQVHCLDQGMQVIMTSNQCFTGTDRVCEVAKKFNRKIYINVQGDEPLIDPNDVLKILETSRRYHGEVINGMCSIEAEEDFYSPNVPKVISTDEGKLLYMSRAAVPTGKKHEFKGAMRQVCIYAFPRDVILEFGRQEEKTKLEEIEDIEILRFLEMGYDVRMVEVKGSPVAVDTPADLERAKKMINA